MILLYIFTKQFNSKQCGNMTIAHLSVIYIVLYNNKVSLGAWPHVILKLPYISGFSLHERVHF